MPMDSAQIAALTGGFNQQVMMGMQHSAMISQMYGGYMPGPMTQPVPSQGQQFAGAAMGAMGNVGMSAFGSQRLNSMGGGIAQPFANAGQYVVGQAMYGAQQQQMLDAGLRQSYRFQNEFGGRGFTQTQTSGIGADLRSMAMQRGPGGETTNFEELGRLASNMGRMGMAEGVRGVKDFNEKFKQMLTSVKTIATELSTSLEEAQKVMASMQGAGIFKNQGQAAMAMRRGSVAGNLATSELSGMAMIGSQISRSVGGLGRQGAMAGMEAITQVGAAQQAGVINEEDIYNVTGLTGAEGRRAFAQQGLSREARFYSGGLGRRMLASIAGKGGTIDENSLQELLSGGGGTQGTMQRAGANLSKIGRADFIRNEGRLRGAAMEKLGMMGSAIQAKDWLDERGMNLNNMNDRSMLFFQRKFGVGRDEADQLVKMAGSLDMISAQRQQAGSNDEYARILEQSQRRQSPQEIIKQLGMGVAGVQNKVRQFGAGLQESMGVGIGEFLGKSSGEYFDRRRADLASSIDTAYRGGQGAKDVLSRDFGIRLGGGGDLGGKARSELYGDGGPTKAQFNRFLGGQSDALTGAGYNIKDIKSQSDYANVMLESHRRQLGFTEGGSQALRGGLDDATRSAMRGQLASAGVGGKEKEFLTNIERSLDRLTTTQGKELAKVFRAATDEERARMAKDVLNAAGAGSIGDGRFGGAGQFASMSIGGGKFATREALQTQLGRNLLQGDTSDISSWKGELGKLGTKASYALGGDATRVGRFVGGLVGEGTAADSLAGKLDVGRGKVRGWGDRVAKGIEGYIGEGAVSDLVREATGGVSGQSMRSVGEFLQGKEGRSVMRGMFSDDADVRKAVTAKSEDRRMELAGKARTQAETAEYKSLQYIQAASELQRLGGGATEEQLRAASDRIFGKGAVSVEQFRKAGGTVLGEYDQQQSDARKQLYQEMGARARREESDFSRRAPDIEKLKAAGKLSPAAEGYMQSIAKERGLRAKMAGVDEVADRSAALGAQSMSEDRERSRLGMSLAQRAEIAGQMAATGGITEMAEAGTMRREISIEKRLKRAGAAGTSGHAQAVAGMLGVNLGKDALKGTSAEQAGIIAGELGLDLVSGDGGIKARKDLEGILADKGKSVTEKAMDLRRFQERPELAEGGRAKQDERSRRDDPSYRVLTDIKDSLANMKTTSASTANSLSTLPVDLAKAMTNPEKGK